VHPGSEIARAADNVRLEQFLQSQMRKEESMTCATFFQQDMGRMEIFRRALTPITDLFLNVHFP